MEVSVKVHKIITVLLYTVLFFFSSGGGVDDMLVRLSLVEEIIKDSNLMCISFGVKHPQAFGES